MFLPRPSVWGHGRSLLYCLIERKSRFATLAVRTVPQVKITIFATAIIATKNPDPLIVMVSGVLCFTDKLLPLIADITSFGHGF